MGILGSRWSDPVWRDGSDQPGTYEIRARPPHWGWPTDTGSPDGAGLGTRGRPGGRSIVPLSRRLHGAASGLHPAPGIRCAGDHSGAGLRPDVLPSVRLRASLAVLQAADAMKAEAIGPDVGPGRQGVDGSHIIDRKSWGLIRNRAIAGAHVESDS